MRLKVHGGTGEKLCTTCTHSFVRRGRTLKEEEIFCNKWAESPQPVPFNVTFCNQYKEYKVLPLYEYELIAWPLLLDKKGKLIGFRAPSEATRLVEDGKANKPDELSLHE